jgi:hypothetical protein
MYRYNTRNFVILCVGDSFGTTLATESFLHSFLFFVTNKHKFLFYPPKKTRRRCTIILRGLLQLNIDTGLLSLQHSTHDYILKAAPRRKKEPTELTETPCITVVESTYSPCQFRPIFFSSREFSILPLVSHAKHNSASFIFDLQRLLSCAFPPSPRVSLVLLQKLAPFRL